MNFVFQKPIYIAIEEIMFSFLKELFGFVNNKI